MRDPPLTHMYSHSQPRSRATTSRKGGLTAKAWGSLDGSDTGVTILFVRGPQPQGLVCGLLGTVCVWG